MKLDDILRKAAVLLETNRNSLFNYDVKKQYKYIEKLGMPQNDIERSFYQYKCQMKLNGYVITGVLNIISLPIVLLYLKKLIKIKPINSGKTVDAVFFRDGKPQNILPLVLYEEFKKIETEPDTGMYINEKDMKYILHFIKKYPLSWHFWLKCIIKIARYRKTIDYYSPRAIIVCAEYSFTSSLLTDFCNKIGILHVNVMHGEKLYHIHDSFFRFNRCYVWEQYYKDLLIKLKADVNQFVIEKPDSLVFPNVKEVIATKDFTYYLGSESEEVLKKIAVVMKKLKNKSYCVSVRPHPRYSKQDIVASLFKFCLVENLDEVSIERSLQNTKYAISLYSTVLTQAIYNGINIVIDDVSNPGNYEKLKELQYICLNVKHDLLSDYIGE